MKKIIVLASGSGSNAENIIKHFNDSANAKVTHLLSNNPEAYALKRAESLGVNTMVFSRDAFYNTGEVLTFLSGSQPDLIVLAGFLWLVPQDIVKAFPNRIVNIHPALLPKYGGKGMYGDKVHDAVLQNGEKESGITIHYVNEHYDEGNTLFQANCSVEPGESRTSLVQKIHALEHAYFPKVIEQLLM
jgi:phosphoribosylglycinamide formyltransferase 1